MKKLLSILFILTAWVYAETVYADPKPTFIHPRKVLFSIIKGDDKSIQHVLSSANNVLKYYGPENIQMRIVTYSGGIRAVLKKESAFAERIDTLMQYEVEFYACANTMRTKKIKKSELLDDVEVVSAGIVEIIERVQEGWIYIKP